MKLSEMRTVLATEGIQLTKSLGQNFLHDANQLRRIVDAAELTARDQVLEIGPGLGSLTEWLLDRAGKVLAIEKDARLVRALQDRFNAGQASGRAPGPFATQPGRPAALDLMHDDALKYFKREPKDWSGWKLVSNLPYSVASPILVELTRGLSPPDRMVVTLQQEVAKRLVAEPGHGDYGVLTLLVQLDFEPRGCFTIPASCFFPAPDVDSACACLLRRPQPLLPAAQRDTFTRIVKRGFSQRRKMMWKLLKEDWSEAMLAKAFSQADLSPHTRAEAVSLNGFVQLTQTLAASVVTGPLPQ